jgi:hypothetical protein
MGLTTTKKGSVRCHFCGELIRSGIDTITALEIQRGHEIGELVQKMICPDCFQKYKKEGLIVTCGSCEGTGEVQDCDGCEELGPGGLCQDPDNHHSCYGEGQCPDCEGKGYILHITKENHKRK